MQLEFHQLDRSWEHLRVRPAGRQRRLLASLAEAGQQTPIVVVASAGSPDRYVVIDGYKRMAALEQLGRDTVAAVVWSMSEAEAVLLDRTLRWSEPETALEQGWLLQEMEQRFHYGLDELARRFDRSVSWVSRRLALVELLPESIQQQVREGKVSAHAAMKFLVPVARQSVAASQRMAAIFVQYRCDTRQAGELYAAWRKASPVVRKRILDQPELFFKTQRQAEPKPSLGTGEELLRDLDMVAGIVNRAQRRLAGAAVAEWEDQQRQAARQHIERIQNQLRRLDEKIRTEPEPYVEPSATDHDFGTAQPGIRQTRDRTSAGDLSCQRAPGVALAGGPSPGVAAPGEGRAIPSPSPGTAAQLQGESRASP